jgi:hypothetical protein
MNCAPARPPQRACTAEGPERPRRAQCDPSAGPAPEGVRGLLGACHGQRGRLLGALPDADATHETLIRGLRCLKDALLFRQRNKTPAPPGTGGNDDDPENARAHARCGAEIVGPTEGDFANRGTPLARARGRAVDARFGAPPKRLARFAAALSRGPRALRSCRLGRRRAPRAVSKLRLAKPPRHPAMSPPPLCPAFSLRHSTKPPAAICWNARLRVQITVTGWQQ